MLTPLDLMSWDSNWNPNFRPTLSMAEDRRHAMTKEAKSGKKREFVQRELDAPVEKVVDQKLKDPSIASEEGDKKAAEELRKAAEKAAKKRTNV